MSISGLGLAFKADDDDDDANDGCLYNVFVSDGIVNAACTVAGSL